MNVLDSLIQNCEMANASSNSTSVVITESDITGALERHKLSKLKRRSLSSLDLVVLGAIMNTVYTRQLQLWKESCHFMSSSSC